MNELTRTKPSTQPDEQYLKKVLVTAVYAGEVMLSSGAETSRVEETINILIRSFGIENSNAVVMPTGMYVSAYNDTLNYPLTLVRRVPKRAINFSRLAAVNELSRQVQRGLITLDETDRELRRIEQSHDPYPIGVLIVAGSCSAAGATLLLGGGLVEAMVALVGSLLVQAVLWLLRESRIPGLFGEFLGGLIATTVVLLATWVGLPLQQSLAIGGGLLPLVPGAALMASVQDGIAGDLLSSAARGLEAFLKGAALACGVGLGITIALSLKIRIELATAPGEVWQIPIQVIAASFAAGCYALSLKLPRGRVVSVGLAGAVCWLSYLALWQSGSSEMLSTAISAFLVGVVSWGLARLQHAPVTIYVLPAVLPLLPGLTIYRGMLALTQNQSAQGLLLLVQAISLGGAIAAGVALSNSLAPALWRKRRIPHPHHRTGAKPESE